MVDLLRSRRRVGHRTQIEVVALVDDHADQGLRSVDLDRVLGGDLVKGLAAARLDGEPVDVCDVDRCRERHVVDERLTLTDGELQRTHTHRVEGATDDVEHSVGAANCDQQGVLAASDRDLSEQLLIEVPGVDLAVDVRAIGSGAAVEQFDLLDGLIVLDLTESSKPSDEVRGECGPLLLKDLVLLGVGFPDQAVQDILLASGRCTNGSDVGNHVHVRSSRSFNLHDRGVFHQAADAACGQDAEKHDNQRKDATDEHSRHHALAGGAEIIDHNQDAVLELDGPRFRGLPSCLRTVNSLLIFGIHGNCLLRTGESGEPV